ncbi:THC0290_0291 family protein [Olleya namhaensis]|uniref:THC0290_0291 family protein n=1 Tax=Olleya namhaensis TaxID=1144750 RepID=UPI002330116D|nr:glutamate dehydrogenase [Olleya namhaensis]
MLNPKHLTLVILILLSTSSAYAQLGFSHEIGIITGPVAFKADFGERLDSDTNVGNTGFGIGLVHYINFAYQADCNCYTTDNYFNDHFKLRTEISFNKTKLNHLGKWVEDSRTSDEADKLRSHTGEANNFDIGMQLEFFPLSIRSFQAFGYRLAPFVSLGAHYVSYNPKVYTDYDNGTNDVGNVLDNNNFYSGWDPGSINPDSGSTWSVVSSIGVRYKLNMLSDLMIDLRGQYYFSDWVDGLDHQLNSNKYNDWLVWLNVGYIYYLD